MAEEQVTISIADALVVEDSPTQALMLKEALEKHNLKVRIAQDGVDALQQIQQSVPQIIISDIEMPRMNGYDLCRHLKTDGVTKKIPVILLTNLTDPMDVIKGIECGADSFLTKPCDIHFLLSTMHDVIKNKKLQKALPQGKQLEFFFGGQKHLIQVDQVQITDLLLSTFSSAIQKNLELEQAYRKLSLTYEEMERKNEELKKANKLKNQLLGMAVHDLRNPLCVIEGYSDCLLKKNLDNESIKMLQRIKKSSSFMLQLINNLLDLSVIESGIVSLHLADVDLDALIKENLLYFNTLAEKKHINLLYSAKKHLPTFCCDPNKITQVFSNLISNAIKFSPPGGLVEIGVDPVNSHILLTIKDSGMGISPQNKERLFQPFVNTQTTGTAGEKGTGLGLAIVQKIVEEHKGKIWVESELGKGSTFFVSIPQQIKNATEDWSKPIIFK